LLLVAQVLGTKSPIERLYDHRVVDRVAQLLDARQMRLLREEHGGARVALTKLDQACQCVVGNRGVVERQASVAASDAWNRSTVAT
jgi:hypothetical protein